MASIPSSIQCSTISDSVCRSTTIRCVCIKSEQGEGMLPMLVLTLLPILLDMLEQKNLLLLLLLLLDLGLDKLDLYIWIYLFSSLLKAPSILIV
jgi:hypothetical protein